MFCDISLSQFEINIECTAHAFVKSQHESDHFRQYIPKRNCIQCTSVFNVIFIIVLI